MIIDNNLVINILDNLNKHVSTWARIYDLADLVSETSNKSELHAPVTDKFVNHLLHLSDLECFVTAYGGQDWGYQVKSDKNAIAGFNHLYGQNGGTGLKTLIRINAEGRNLLEFMTNDHISKETKDFGVGVGGQVVSSILSATLLKYSGIG